MTFIKFLQGIGDRFGILESVSTAESAPATRIQTRVVSLQELVSEMRSGEVKALADSPGELAAAFEKIYEAAGISPKPGEWTMDRLREVIQKETDQKKSRAETQKAVLDLLKSEGVPSEILVRDAIARDQALDAFEARVGEIMGERKETCRRRLLEIETQIKNLQDENAKISENLKIAEKKWHEWRKGKRAHERELASLVGYLVDHPVVTMDEEDVDYLP
jgi:hypothetical protein